MEDKIRLAEKYLYGDDNTHKDINIGIDILISEGQKGNFKAYYELGDFILNNDLENYSNEDAKSFLIIAAKQGIRDARIKLYEIYSNNNYGLINHRGAIYWLMKSKIHTESIYLNFKSIIDSMFFHARFSYEKLDRLFMDLVTYYKNAVFIDYKIYLLETAMHNIKEISTMKLQEAKTLTLVKDVLNYIDESLSQFDNYQTKEYILIPIRNMCFSMIGNRLLKEVKNVEQLLEAKNYYLKITDGEVFKQTNLDKVYSLLCKAYLFGEFGTEIDEIDALEYYEKIVNKSKDLANLVDCYLIKKFNYHYNNKRYISALKYLELLSTHTPEQTRLKSEIKENINNDLKLPKISINKKIDLSYNPDTMYFVELKDRNINIEDNCIYYFIDYYKTDIVVRSSNYYVKRNHDLILNIKDPKHYSDVDSFKFFKKIIEKYLKGTHRVWYICTVPGHDQINSFRNRMSDLLDSVSLTSNFIKKYDLIKKTMITEPKHKGGIRDWKLDLKSLGLNSTFDYSNKSFIVFDDVTTSGSSLKAMKKMLMNAGAKSVICIALAKTKGDN